MEVLGPKGPFPYGGVDRSTWMRNQLRVAAEILDNPGGGLLFATQTIGQVKAALGGQSGSSQLVNLLDQAEEQVVRRQFAQARALLSEMLRHLEPVAET
ncbi:MAG: hypothetical protein JF888_09175 [Candidatus Dormibacteraeota bacterium]|uniref:Uncharacterized protein n=1 Tax=Candidatus Dormiibacter inghamiae TaxID=3127013 RepID=A0A934K7V2_9BACT|nr:hypothetical protein [Candidatus Dormibacteraeota bacterium]MBJ7606543.1 hypothetical protein [Candidatus Dormibacteraeota bacterium]